MDSAALSRALRTTHHIKESRVRGLFSRLNHVTRPPASMRTGVNRLMYDTGRVGLPTGLGYFAGKELGLWGQHPGGQDVFDRLPENVDLPTSRANLTPQSLRLRQG